MGLRKVCFCCQHGRWGLKDDQVSERYVCVSMGGVRIHGVSRDGRHRSVRALCASRSGGRRNGVSDDHRGCNPKRELRSLRACRSTSPLFGSGVLFRARSAQWCGTDFLVCSQIPMRVGKGRLHICFRLCVRSSSERIAE